MAIYTNSVMNAIYTTLSSNQTIVNCGVLVEQYAIDNTDPNKTTWINVLDPEIAIVGRRLNISEPWMETINVTIKCQVQNYQNIEEQYLAVRELNDLRDNVWSAVNSNRTLDNTVHIITGFQMARVNIDQTQSDDFLESQLVLTAEVFA